MVVIRNGNDEVGLSEAFCQTPYVQSLSKTRGIDYAKIEWK